MLCIAETLRRFDVVAVQEVGSTAEAIKATMSHLGGDWAFLVTDVTLGDAGNHERLAFVFDRERLRPSGLACELVLAPEDFGVTTDVLGRQFARTPYGVSFAREPNVFTLVTLHVVYGNAPGDRVGELAKIAEWLADWATTGDEWGENLIALGDFNIDRQVDEDGDVDELYKAFIDTGLRPPDNLNHVPRTITDDPDPTAPADRRHYYDQIAWFTGQPNGPPASSLGYRNSGCSTSRRVWSLRHRAGALVPDVGPLPAVGRVRGLRRYAGVTRNAPEPARIGRMDARVRIAPGAPESLGAIAEIYHHYVRTSPATFDLGHRSDADVGAWFDGFGERGPHRLLVALDRDRVLGYASSSPFRPRAAYARTVETSVYLDPTSTGRGVGSALVEALLSELETEQVHRACAGIALPNPASVRLHERFGYRHVGTFTEQGYKFGRYWDVAWFERAFPERVAEEAS